MIDEAGEREKSSRWFSAFLAGVAAGIFATFFVMVHFQEQEYVRKDEVIAYLATAGYKVLTVQEVGMLRGQANCAGERRTSVNQASAAALRALP